jgi:hypothetical protein
MTNKIKFPVALVCLLGLFITINVGCAPKKYIPKVNEELYGTWINEKSSYPKLEIYAGGSKLYYDISSSSSTAAETAEEIVSKYKDHDGNAIYQTQETVIGGLAKGDKAQNLIRISKDGKTLEVENKDVVDFDSKYFPVDFSSHADNDYHIFYRQ